jgi:predicted 2-oxoglutarate/Fe(II)-dependent dioxygenase YbiX
MSSILMSKKDCEYIKSFWDQSNYQTEKTDSRFKIDNINTIKLNYKNVKGSYFDCKDESLINFITEKLKLIDVEKISSGSVKINKYIEGDYFGPHHDFNAYGKGAVYKTLVIQLTDPSTYKGGDLYVKGIPQSREQGSYSLFFSSDIHEIKLVEWGTRFSLVIFLFESDFNNKKRII